MNELKIVSQLVTKHVCVGVLKKRLDQTDQWAVWLWIRKCLKAGIIIDHIGYGKDIVYTYACWTNRPTEEFKALTAKLFI